MSAPRRLLDEDASGLERDLLRAGLAIDPPEGAQEAVWAGILANLPVPPPPAGQGGTGAGKAASGKAAAALAKTGAGGAAAGGGILSAVLIGAGSAVVCIAAYSVVVPSAPEPSLPPPTLATLAPSSEPVQTRSPPSPPAVRLPPAEPAAATPSPDPSADRRAPAEARAAEHETMLREESRLLGEARAALRGGDAAGALGMLDQIRERFPAGGLAQEREALSIEALARSGRRDEAAARAAAFVKAYPASPLAAGVQGFAH